VNPRARRLILLVLGVVLAWYVAVVIWAARPTTDAVPVGNIPSWQSLPVDPSTSVPPATIPAGGVVVRKIECGTVFDGDALTGTLPALPFPQQLNREPCDLQHSNGRLIFGLDTLVMVGVAGAGTALLIRSRRRHRRSVATDDQPLAAAAR